MGKWHWSFEMDMGHGTLLFSKWTWGTHVEAPIYIEDREDVEDLEDFSEDAEDEDCHLRHNVLRMQL
jgi:hypothetical protein